MIKTKIVATIGPASEQEDLVRQMILAGMNVTRLNFSHGNHATHRKRYNQIRQISEELGIPVAVMQDLQGPKIRTGKLQDGRVDLKAGQELTLCTGDHIGDENRIAVDFPGLPQCVQPGSRILLADGQMELVVTGVEPTEVQTEVVLGGELTAHKGVNLPGAHLDMPGFTEKDEADLAMGLELGVDAVAISFVRKPNDVQRVRDSIQRNLPDGPAPILIAKLERPEALANLDGILEIADGVMVARGDLGVEMSPEEVPIAQKRIIEAANRNEKIVITATQMLESMMVNPRPTRAEASDVANAIFDGTDAVMLSGETAVGQYPLKAVEMMVAISNRAESNLAQWGRWQRAELNDSRDDAYFITLAASELTHDRNVAAITVFTSSGRTALMMSKARPEVPILAFTPEQHTYRRLAMLWGVTPHRVDQVNTVEEMLACVEETMLNSAVVRPGQQIVLVCGFPVGGMRPPNLALLHTIGEPTMMARGSNAG